VDAVRERWPEAKILAVGMVGELRGAQISQADATVYPGCGDDVTGFLFDHLRESDTAGLAVLHWEPACDLRPSVRSEVDRIIGSVVRQIAASSVTAGYFGRKWAHNALINTLNLASMCVPRTVPDLAIIVAAGPGLEETLPKCAEVMRKRSIWATPSALPCLAHYGIVPDIVIVTDPGWYTVHHFRGLPETLPIAAPLTVTAGLPGDRRLIIDQSSFVEGGLFSQLDLPRVEVPANGTVSGSAYVLARRLGVTRIVFLGLDTASFDLRSHCRPHSFDHLLAASSDRLHPLETIKMSRVASETRVAAGSKWRVGRSLHTYAAWFRRNAGDSPGVFRISDSPVELGIPRISVKELREIAGEASRESLVFDTEQAPPSSDRRRAVNRVVSEWRELSAELYRSSGSHRAVVARHEELLSRVAMPELIRYRRSGPDQHLHAFGRLTDSYDRFVGGVEKFCRAVAP
jgi:hypothetical protein